MKILLTGGTGYIASHTALVLAEAGHEVILYDNLSNSNLSVVDRLVTITGQNYIFIRGDVRDTELLSRTLKQYNIDAVIHFAGLKALGESIEKPIDYYDNNICGTISLLQSMQASNVKNLVFRVAQLFTEILNICLWMKSILLLQIILMAAVNSILKKC